MRKSERLLGVAVVAVLLAAGVTAQGVLGDHNNEGPLWAWNPPLPCEGIFTDVPCGTQFDTWVEQYARDGITSGCAAGKYCPESPVTRRQMAVLMERAMRGASGWPPHTVLVFHHPAAETNSDVNSGTELLAMVAAIPSTGPEAPSASNPWLVKVGPGTFNLGSGWLTLPAYTALEGAGEDITMITASGNADSHATVTMGDRGRLSRLTVVSTGSNDYEVAIHIPPGASSIVIEHASVTASNQSNPGGSSYGVMAAQYASFRLEHCHVVAEGAYITLGVYADSSSSVIRLDSVDVHVSSSDSSGTGYGLIGYATSLSITSSRFEVLDGSGSVGILATGGGSLELRDSVVWTNGAGSKAVRTDGVNAILAGDSLNAAGVGFATTGSGVLADISNCSITGVESWLINALGPTVTVGASKLVGATGGNSTTHCFGNYTDTAFLANTCP